MVVFNSVQEGPSETWSFEPFNCGQSVPIYTVGMLLVTSEKAARG
jgi:hypothetical protein